jgi:hypothetical protein
MKRSKMLWLGLLLFGAACGNREAGEVAGLHEAETPAGSSLPEESPIEKFPATVFLPTLEEPAPTGKNAVYAAAFRFAWAKALSETGQGIPSKAAPLAFLNSSLSYRDVLRPEEYEADVTKDAESISVHAFFKKTLPFETKMQLAEEGIAFGKDTVDGFGMRFYSEDVARQADILYYRDDEHFILRVRPRDRDHELLFAKGLPAAQSLWSAYLSMNKWIISGDKERSRENSEWKYTWNVGDDFLIPDIAFNISTHYPQIEGQRVFAGQLPFVREAKQRTALLLNNTGAIIESEAIVTTVSVDTSVSRFEPPPPPKRLRLDGPFFLVAKRTDQKNPYFFLSIANTELLHRRLH